MRVLLTNTARSWSGETAYVEMMAQGLASRGCQVHLASRAESQLGQRVRRAGLDVTELDMRRTPIALFRDIVILRRLAIDFDPDVVHCNASLDTWLCASVFWLLRHRALRLRTKHNLKRIRGSVFNRFLYRTALHALIAPSTGVFDHLQESAVTRSVAKSVVLNGIRLDRFHGDLETRSRARQELLTCFPEVQDPLIAIYLSRMSPRKQPEVAVQAVLRLAGSEPARPVVLAVVGSTEGETARSCIDLAGGDPHISFLGFRTDVAWILAGADVFLLPSLHEPFGLAAIEAMACGTVPILPRAGSFPAMLDNSRAGVLYDPEDQVSGICQAILSLIKGGGRELSKRSEVALVHAQGFNAEDMVDGTLSYYHKLRDS